MKTNFFNTDTIEHFASEAHHLGWDQMLIEARRFVVVDCDWVNVDDMEDIFKDLINQVKQFMNL